MGRTGRVLILVENLPSPFDRRVWHEACTLRDAGDVVFIICPTGRGCERKFEAIDGIHIYYRYRLPFEAAGADDEVLALLNTADVCVNPDIANDMNDKSTMNKIMEYMALGKPVVQFDLAEGRYSAQRGSLCARKNDPSDLAAKIVELLNDPARRAEMGVYGRRRVENELAWHHEAPKLLAAYRALWRSKAVSPAERSVET